MLRIGELFRVTRIARPDIEFIDGIKNYYYETTVPGHSLFSFRAGINKAADVTDVSGNKRCPVIVIDSSPASAGTLINPWRDEFYPDRGVIKYYGDNKIFEKEGMLKAGKPEEQNNKYLLYQARISASNSREERLNYAVPIVFFEKSGPNGLRKFQGYGVVEHVEMVTQYNEKHNIYFPNYLFTFCVFSLKSSQEMFDWSWIARRCDPSYTAEDDYKYAPREWQRWIDNGNEKLHLVRRNMAAFGVIKPRHQKVTSGSAERKLLDEIYHYYDGRKHDFEFLALEVTRKVIEEAGATVKPGWVTRKSGDHGIDFVLRVDLGNDRLAGLQIIVLGQAKCEDPDKQANGRDIARLVARLKRGWIGAFVTLQTFSEMLQVEVKEDQYPVMLINGKKVVEIVKREMFQADIKKTAEYLDNIKAAYQTENKSPEDILE